MKIFLVLFLCLLFAASAPAQTENVPEPAETGVEEITLMRDDGEGNAGDETDVFKTTDIPIHCQILLNSIKPAVVKMNLVAAEVRGLKTGMKILSVSYKTNGKQNVVVFRGSPEKIWLAGKYRVDIFIDNKLGGSKAFEIQKPAPQKSAPANSAKPKIVKRSGKN